MLSCCQLNKPLVLLVDVIGINNSSYMAEVVQVYFYLQDIILTSTFPQQLHKTNITAVKEEQNMHK